MGTDRVNNKGKWNFRPTRRVGKREGEGVAPLLISPWIDLTVLLGATSTKMPTSTRPGEVIANPLGYILDGMEDLWPPAPLTSTYIKSYSIVKWKRRRRVVISRGIQSAGLKVMELQVSRIRYT